MIPFERLDNVEILQSLDFTYYLAECRRVLKYIYNKEFKNENNTDYTELRNYLQHSHLQKKLIHQVFMTTNNKHGIANWALQIKSWSLSIKLSYSLI